MRILNLDKLTHEENKILNEVANEIRLEFNALVEFVGHKHEKNIDWIVSSIASRNKYLSPLFIRCCNLALIKRLIEQDQELKKIILSDRALGNSLKRFFKSEKREINIVCTERILTFCKQLLRPFYSFVVAATIMGLRILGRSNTRKWKSYTTSITLVDTFVLNSKVGENGSIYQGKYRDRYFPGLLDNMDEYEKESVYYYPTLNGFKNILKAFNIIRNAKDRFIIPDDFLKITDYLYFLLHPFRIQNLKLPETHFLKFNITSLLKQERFLNCCNSSSLLGLLNYRFALRTAQEKIKIKRLIDWHENQVNDRGMIVGFRRHHPETKIIGYQGYIISKSLHSYIFPTPSECRSQAVPHQIGVIGKGLLKDIQEFSSDFQAIVAPAFRFSKVWDNRRIFPEIGIFTILVALPIGLKGASNILECIGSGLQHFDKSRVRFWIKPHPTYGKEKIKQNLDEAWTGFFQAKSGDFNECIEGANLLIGNASSTSLEAVTKGVPVIIVGDSNGIIENPIPGSVSEDIWRLCYSSVEIVKAIQYYMNQDPKKMKEYKKIGERTREEYFEPVTKRSVSAFLNIDVNT
jgi:hypothetical protein